MISQFKHFSYQIIPSYVSKATYVIITLLTIVGCSEELPQQSQTTNYYQSAALLTISPEPSYTIARDYLGQISAKQHTNLSFEYSGKISEVLVDNGDTVTKGQLLAQQDTQLLSYKTAELQAQIAQSQAQITLNKANLTRIKSLIDDGYSSQQKLDELNSENQVLNAQINGLNARINTLEYQQEKSSLVAPFDGVITKRLISKGEVITASTPSFRLIESANNEINVGIPSKVATKLSIGQQLEVTVNNQKNKAELIAVGKQIDPINRTVQLRLKMQKTLNESSSFNGQLVRITIPENINKTGFWLPVNAITDGVRGQWQILIATELPESKNHFQLQAATINILHATEDNVYVTGLSKKSHNIIAEGVHRFVPGQIITTTASELTNAVGDR